MNDEGCKLIGWLPPAGHEDEWYEMSGGEVGIIIGGDSTQPRLLKLVNNQRLYFAVPKLSQVNCGDIFICDGLAIGTVSSVKKQRGHTKDKIVIVVVDTSLIKK